ncbi:probable CCR4-associated factor 1 homolog 6 [Setaria viridis]|uniref:probable CCR4-associated factor 1 homolog 6 n=1 Tax=Setaria viridis TaxID=4556 RepID=UPI003B3A5F9A
MTEPSSAGVRVGLEPGHRGSLELGSLTAEHTRLPLSSPLLLQEDSDPIDPPPTSSRLAHRQQPHVTSHGLSPPLTLGLNALHRLRLRLRLLPLLLLPLLLLPPPTRAARPLPPTSETLILTVVGTTLPARRSSAPSLPELLDAPAAPMAAPPPAAEGPDAVEIREVWADNLEQEFAVIRDVIDAYPYVAMDTEFPGIVVKPTGSYSCQSDVNYATLQGNVNILKLIQLGLTLSNEAGALPPRGTGGRGCIWQFNFRGFDPRTDPSSSISIDLLRRSGIDFDRFAAEGVDSTRFSELMMTSGLVLSDSVQWVTFHSGHDFGYLLRLLTGREMPNTLDEFLELTKTFFPVMYDVKHLMRFCSGLYGGLSKLGELLKVERVGTSHQAGSDSLLTLWCFLKVKNLYLKESVKLYDGLLFGLIPGEGVIG